MGNGVKQSHWLLRDKNEEPVGVGIFTEELIACHLFSFLELVATHLTRAEYDTYLTMNIFKELPPSYVHDRIMERIG